MGNTVEKKQLYLKFHGRIIDSLGIQMYQSPVAALAELIANAWDADAEKVEISLPTSLSGNPSITIKDDGLGMSFDQCQQRYLNVGRNKRADDGVDTTPVKKRKVLGRKGIGKFAGFGISNLLTIETVSQETGEKTVFQMDLNYLRGDNYVEQDAKEINVIEYLPPDEKRKEASGTIIKLENLKILKIIPHVSFSESMSRRFLLHQQADDFKVFVNGNSIPEDSALSGIEFEFPKNYTEDERPKGLKIEKGWGIETINGDQEIKWKIRFCKKPIGHEELNGVSIFCGGKVAQTPFLFQLAGGLAGQHGQEYLNGIVIADYIDALPEDIITTERQRINWEHKDAAPLLEWGQERVKQLLKLWQERRAEEKTKKINDKLSPFSQRMAKLKATERKVIESAIKKLAQIETLSEIKFIELAEALLTAWEGGRLKELIRKLSEVEDMDANELVKMLAEESVLSSLHIAETVRAKIGIIQGLRRRIEEKELENAVRDYIAKHPWLISPEWERFAVEHSLGTIVQEAAKKAELDKDEDWAKRVDLLLKSHDHLLVIEFMRPSLTVDRDHLDRFEYYIDVLRDRLLKNTDFELRRITGLLVADKLNKDGSAAGQIKRMDMDDMRCIEWPLLLAKAEIQWKDFFEALKERSPDDDRLKNL